MSRFELDRWVDVPERSGFPFGPLVELLQVINRVPHEVMASITDVEALLRVAHRALDDLSVVGVEAAFACLGRVEAERLGRNSGCAFRSFLHDGRTGQGYVHTGAVLDDVYLSEVVTGQIGSSDYDEVFTAGGLASASCLRSLSLGQAYFATHLAFYSTLFGDRPCALSAENRLLLAGLLRRLSASAVRRCDVDLAVECEAGLALIDLSSVNQDLCVRLILEIDRCGYLPGLGDSCLDGEGADGATHFESSYHTNIAYLVLGSALLRACGCDPEV
ncbi:DUF6895 family protein [Actinomyces ruminis]|uniref:DUF6895 family protein n=1 Tax=Actinomyces ruminis TaxID=1937003 RepID=UPI001177FFE5|nr:hypothetical protein [Actinomyces ruminis]